MKPKKYVSALTFEAICLEIVYIHKTDAKSPFLRHFFSYSKCTQFMNEHLSLNKSVGIFMVVFKHRACFSFFSRNDYTRFIPLKTRGGVLITSPGGFIVSKMILSHRETRILLE